MASTYQRYFKRPVHHQPHNTFLLSGAELRRPCLYTDPVLHEMVRFYLEANSETNLVSEVTRHIQALLPKQRCNLEQVALRMELLSRALQRRLAIEGIEFEQLLTSARCRQAENLLRNTSLSVVQIVRELGYRRSSSFCRAHRRWFACTPQDRREQHGNAILDSDEFDDD